MCTDLPEVVVVVGVVHQVVLGAHDRLRVAPLQKWHSIIRITLLQTVNINGSLTTASWMLVAQTPEKKSRKT